MKLTCPNCQAPAFEQFYDRIDPVTGKRYRVRQVDCSSRKKRFTARKTAVVYEGCGPTRTEEEIP